MILFFWKFWNNSRNDYIEAIKIDHRLRNSKDVAFEEYQELADKKSTFGKIAAIYSLKILSNTEDANIIYQKILLSHYYFSIGLQLYDDVKDLKKIILIINLIGQFIY
jgi:vacuolar-type H+-ATPase catalytic subunit A/Vma1